MTRIAILDSGVAVSVLDQFDKMDLISEDFCGSGNISDLNGHGTHIFGIVAAQVPLAKLYIGKVFKSEMFIAPAAVARGFRWAINQHVDIILSCVGLRFDDPEFREVIEEAISNKILVVSAIGNEGDGSLNAGEFPARYPGVISVASVGNGDKLSKFSNHPPGLDFLAPGEDIESRGLEGKPEIMTGTSQAAAYVAGVLGRIIEECRERGIEYSRQQLLDLLNRTGRKAKGANLPKIVDGEAALAFVQESVSL